MNGNNKRKAKAAKAAALVMTLMLTVSTLLSGCGEAEVSERTEDSTATAKTVVWDYVSPSDLKGDTAKTEEEEFKGI